MPRFGLPELLILLAVIVACVGVQRVIRLLFGPRKPPPSAPPAVLAGVPRRGALPERDFDSWKAR